ncbi:MAG TPA: glycogen-binding domain-containing protein [Phycisphaerae bacterium]|nr:glycogen-binding domain-containing protein [Phycisphaerae bacterium]
MYAKGSKNGTVRFSLKPPGGAKRVMLAGSFNGWKPAPMRKQKGGAFALTVPLASGSHEYKFIVDGEWVVDSENPTWAMNPYGTFNSVAQVER